MILTKPPRRAGAGGTRPGAGRRAATSDGAGVERVSVTLDHASRAVLTAYGNGNLSEGIRRAARVVAGDVDAV